MNKEIYFCLCLTENEHDIIKDSIQLYCEENGLELKYYRKLKDGHVPMYREVKVCGDQYNINVFKNWARNDYKKPFFDDFITYPAIFNFMQQNPHKLINN